MLAALPRCVPDSDSIPILESARVAFHNFSRPPLIGDRRSFMRFNSAILSVCAALLSAPFALAEAPPSATEGSVDSTASTVGAPVARAKGANPDIGVNFLGL